MDLPADDESVRLIFEDDGMTETVRAVHAGSHLYRLLETPVFSQDFTVHDIVSVTTDSDNRLRILDIVEHSGWSKDSWFTWTPVIQSARLRLFLDEVAAAGGHYQVDSFLPRIEVSFPPGAHFDVRAAFERAFADAHEA